MTRPDKLKSESQWTESVARVKSTDRKWDLEQMGAEFDRAGRQQFADRVILILAVGATMFAIALILTGN